MARISNMNKNHYEFVILKVLYNNPNSNISRVYKKSGSASHYYVRYWIDEFLIKGFLDRALKSFNSFYSLNEAGKEYYHTKLKELKNMKCPKCNEGTLEEDNFDKNIGECDNCGAMFEGKGLKKT